MAWFNWLIQLKMVENTHNYTKFSEQYSKLGISETYYLAYRDIPSLIKDNIKGAKTLDFGCGSGRSTRFLQKLNLDVIGVDKDISQIEKAKELDNLGEYILINKNKFPFEDGTFDLIFSSAVFMEIPSKKDMEKILQEFNRVLKNEGKIIIVTDAQEMYKHDCISFKYPNKSNIKGGDRVKLIINNTNIEFEDYYWEEKDYCEVFNKANLKIFKQFKPLGKETDIYNWISEDKFPHWSIYVLTKHF